MPARRTKKDDPVVPMTGPSHNVDASHRIDAPAEMTSSDVAVMLANWLRALRVGRGLFRLHAIVDGECACHNPRCGQAGKHPAERWGATATLNPAAIEQKFRMHPTAGIGIATGRGLLVLDFDAGRGGIGALRQLEHVFPAVREAPRVLTGAIGDSRGRHVYLRLGSGAFIPSRANALPGFKGVDVRCAGGYAVAPGTLHRSGVRYEWERPAAELPPVPDELVSMLQERETKRERGGVARERSQRPLSSRMSGYLRDGIPLDAENGQRGAICSLARALLELPSSVDEAAERIWGALLNSEWSKDPWTEEQVYEIVADIDNAERPALRAHNRFAMPARKVRRER